PGGPVRAPSPLPHLATLSGSFIPPSPRGLCTSERAMSRSAIEVGESGSETTSGTPRSAPSRSAGSSPTRPSTGTSWPTARPSVSATRSPPPVPNTSITVPSGSLRLVRVGRRPDPLGHPGGGLLRCGDHDHLRARQQLGHRDRDVARAGRQVQQQHVQVPPEHVRGELLDRTVHLGPAPHHRLP